MGGGGGILGVRSGPAQPRTSAAGRTYGNHDRSRQRESFMGFSVGNAETGHIDQGGRRRNALQQPGAKLARVACAS